MIGRNTLLFTALAAAVFTATPAFAQDAPPTDATVEAGVPQTRLVDAYAATLFAGDADAAGAAITALRSGGDFTATTTVMQQATNADGTLATNPDGTPKMEAVTVQTVVANPNGTMGWGEVDHSLALAKALVDGGQAGSFQDALLGDATISTVTNPDGTTTSTARYDGGILQMRASGMGWGQIAKALGFNSLGEVQSGRYADTGAPGGRAADRAVRAERVAAKPEKVERVARVERPERPERPAKPERGRP